MKFSPLVFAASALFAIAGLNAEADQLRIDVSGTYTKDLRFGESFGSFDAALPISVSLLIDESQGFYLPAGTPLMNGQPVAEDSLVVPATAVTSLSAAVGDLRWTESDLSPLPHSDIGIRPGVILMGDLQSDSVKIYCMVSNEFAGSLSLAYLKCDDSGCHLNTEAWGADYRTGSQGKVSGIIASVSRAEGSLQK